MLPEALACGMGMQDFWEATPGETGALIRARRRRDAYQAWLIGNYVRAAVHAKRYPNAPQTQEEPEPPRGPMSWQDQKAVLMRLVERGRS